MSDTGGHDHDAQNHDAQNHDAQDHGAQDHGGEHGTQIPPTLAAAWGLRQEKGPRRLLSVGRIIQAATQVALADGLTAVSMNRVAGELGTAAMSLYRYISGKDELLRLMVDHAYGDPPEPPETGEGWRAGLTRWAWAEMEVLRRHPWILQIPISGPPLNPNEVAWMEYGLRCLAETGLRPEEKLSSILLVTGYVRNTAVLITQLAVGEKSRKTAVTSAEYGRLLARLIDRERFPELSAVVEAGTFESASFFSEDSADEFEFGLERILDGIGLLIRSRAEEAADRVSSAAPAAGRSRTRRT